MKVDCIDCICYFKKKCGQGLEKNFDSSSLFYYNLFERITHNAIARVTYDLSQNKNNNCYGFISKHYKEKK